MLSNNALDDADLKSRLARFGINQPITDTTRNLLLKKLLKLEMDFKNEQNNQSTRLDCESMTNKNTVLSSGNKFCDADLKSRLARFGINQPITNTTRNVLLKKLVELEMDFKNEQNNQSKKFSCESLTNKYTVMSSSNKFCDADIKSRLARFGLNIPITNTTRNVLLKKLLKLEMDFKREQNNQLINLCYKSMTNEYTIMSSSNALDDADLKSRLARFGINQPITNTTRNILLKKLLKLEMDFKKEQNNQSTRLDCESMDTTTNDMNEYEIRDGISKYGLKQVPLTDSTRPLISSIIRKKKEF